MVRSENWDVWLHITWFVQINKAAKLSFIFLIQTKA